MGPSPHPDMADINIHEPGVRKILSDLKPHSAAGPEEIPARLLKNFASILARPLSCIFKASVDQGTIPLLGHTLVSSQFVAPRPPRHLVWQTARRSCESELNSYQKNWRSCKVSHWVRPNRCHTARFLEGCQQSSPCQETELLRCAR